MAVENYPALSNKKPPLGRYVFLMKNRFESKTLIGQKKFENSNLGIRETMG